MSKILKKKTNKNISSCDWKPKRRNTVNFNPISDFTNHAYSNHNKDLHFDWSGSVLYSNLPEIFVSFLLLSIYITLSHWVAIPWLFYAFPSPFLSRMFFKNLPSLSSGREEYKIKYFLLKLEVILAEYYGDP